MKLTMQFIFKSETYDESLFAWFLGGWTGTWCYIMQNGMKFLKFNKFMSQLKKSVWFPQKCFSLYEMYNKYINCWCFTFHSIFMQKYENLTPKKSIFWHFSSFGKMPKMSIFSHRARQDGVKGNCFTQLFMSLNGLYNNMVSWVLLVIYE